MRTRLIILSVFVILWAAVPAEAIKVYRTKSEGLAKCDVDWTSYKRINSMSLISMMHSVRPCPKSRNNSVERML